jgi:hypothetical protein
MSRTIYVGIVATVGLVLYGGCVDGDSSGFFFGGFIDGGVVDVL